MATHKQVIVEDDLDGTAGAHTVSFGLANKSYEIDLTDDHEAELQQLLGPYIHRARRVSRRSRSQAGRQPRRGADSATIRAWAEQQGMEVPQRGRLPRHIVEAYEAAHR